MCVLGIRDIIYLHSGIHEEAFENPLCSAALTEAEAESSVLSLWLFQSQPRDRERQAVIIRLTDMRLQSGWWQAMNRGRGAQIIGPISFPV